MLDVAGKPLMGTLSRSSEHVKTCILRGCSLLSASTKKVFLGIRQARMEQEFIRNRCFSIALARFSLSKPAECQFSVSANFAAAVALEFNVGDHATIGCDN